MVLRKKVGLLVEPRQGQDYDWHFIVLFVHIYLRRQAINVNKKIRLSG